MMIVNEDETPTIRRATMPGGGRDMPGTDGHRRAAGRHRPDAGRHRPEAGGASPSVRLTDTIIAPAAGLTTALLAALAMLASPAAHAASSSHARTLRATDSATLHYVSSTVSVFYETGRATGTLPGWMRVHMRLGNKFSGRYVIETKGGSIRGSGAATAHGRGTIESFAGTITVTGGSGRFRHAHGHARVYGTFNRISNQLKLHTTGTLRY